ncbi:hypothetical protein HMPREF0454_03390 [Hafnia alvei ATCC 51873]|uniref:Uncharacterized protein n=2 Tax=Hafnia alvei TaxID=569 RepID=G9Y9X1_HAFAL|nr:hypothetical protein HMPREF0454_03390 [Hafnia alvei ATCC 51873]
MREINDMRIIMVLAPSASKDLIDSVYFETKTFEGREFPLGGEKNVMQMGLAELDKFVGV